MKDRSVLAARAGLSRSTEAYAVFTGNPATFMK